MNPKWIAENFQLVQGMILILFIFIGFLTLRGRSQESRFKVREADRTEPNLRRPGNPNATADQKLKVPLSLPGIRLNGLPHEVLGIQATATEDEINRAFKELMKKYHPDRMQNVAPDQLKFYQDAATQINQAKEKMLAKLKNR